MSYLPKQRPNAILSKGSAQSTTSGSPTYITFSSISGDSNFFNVASNDRLAIPNDGLYIVSLQVTWAANSAGLRSSGIEVYDSSNVLKRSVYNGYTPVTLTHSDTITSSFVLVAGDYIKAWVYQTSGGSLDINSTGTDISIVRVV